MHRWIKGILAGTTTAAFGVILGLTPIGASFEQTTGLSWLFKLRGPIRAPENVVIVAIDDQTGSQLGLSKLPREWPRSIHGHLVENLKQMGASSIIFDIDFQIPKQAEDDALFAKAVADSGKVIFVEKLVGKRQQLVNTSGKQTGSVWVEQLTPPFPGLASVAKGLGPFPLPKVQVEVHQFWTFKESISAPTMPAIALQAFLMDAYPDFAQLINEAGIPAPAMPNHDARAPEMIDFMRKLRSIFIQKPELGNIIREKLDNEYNLNTPNTDLSGIKALLGLYEGGDQRYLNFYGPPGSITTIPYHLIANRDKGESVIKIPDLKGKAVFVGFSDLFDPGQPDRFYTVFTNDEGVDLSGIEIAATSFSNLLTDKSIQPPTILEEIILVTTFGLIIGTITFLLPAIAGVPLALLLAGGYIVVAQHFFTWANLWLPVAIPILIQLPIALFFGLLVQYFLEREKKTRATKAIGLYLPEHLAKNFTESNLDQDSLNRVTYSVCFASDMAGFTTISEILKPKELAAFLNDYFETLSKPLRHHGVDVIEFRADGIMCAWTAEQPEPNIRRKALLAGLEAIEAIDGFKKRYPQFPQSLRIGLEDGMAYVGHAGGGGHFVYSIVGDCANTAARIEGLNKQLHTQLLASGSAIKDVEGLLTRFLGEFRFVGKTEPLPILEVIALSKSANLAQQQLCESFAKAMYELEQGRWREAGDAFEMILKVYPEDGPSKFHLARCRRFSQSPSTEAPLVVNMDSK